MSDFLIRKKEERTSKTQTISFVKPTKHELSLVLKIVLFIATFFGLTFLSMSSNNLMLKEILISGGILTMVFFIHILSNR